MNTTAIQQVSDLIGNLPRGNVRMDTFIYNRGFPNGGSHDCYESENARADAILDTLHATDCRTGHCIAGWTLMLLGNKEYPSPTAENAAERAVVILRLLGTKSMSYSTTRSTPKAWMRLPPDQAAAGYIIIK